MAKFLIFHSLRFLILTSCFLLPTSHTLLAFSRVEEVDEDGDGRKESKIFYDEFNNRVKGEVDMNADGKPDRWVVFKDGFRRTAEDDKDFDGRIDYWSYYDSKGILRFSASDTNKDGKPDKYNTSLKGRVLVLREYDRNFDGKIDRRALTEWGMIKYGPGQPATPGYVTLWSEEDNDYDGKIDVYKERGNKNPPKDKLGKPIQQFPNKPKEEQPRSGESIPAGEGEKKIRRLNEKHGLT